MAAVMRASVSRKRLNSLSITWDISVVAIMIPTLRLEEKPFFSPHNIEQIVKQLSVLTFHLAIYFTFGVALLDRLAFILVFFATRDRKRKLQQTVTIVH